MFAMGCATSLPNCQVYFSRILSCNTEAEFHGSKISRRELARLWESGYLG